MDSIKRSLSAFQTAIDSLDADTLVPTNNLYKLQFDVFHELRQEAWGDLNEQYCVSGTLDTLFQLNHFLERSPGAKVEVFGSHIVMTWTHYYLGNCQKWTTSRYYLIRED